MHSCRAYQGLPGPTMQELDLGRPHQASHTLQALQTGVALLAYDYSLARRRQERQSLEVSMTTSNPPSASSFWDHHPEKESYLSHSKLLESPHLSRSTSPSFPRPMTLVGSMGRTSRDGSSVSQNSEAVLSARQKLKGSCERLQRWLKKALDIRKNT